MNKEKLEKIKEEIREQNSLSIMINPSELDIDDKINIKLLPILEALLES